MSAPMAARDDDEIDWYALNARVMPTPPSAEAAPSHLRARRGPCGRVVDVLSSDGHWVALHSTRDPVAEAMAWLDAAIAGPPPAVVVLIGLGLGHVVDAFEARAFRGRIVAIEPDAALARAFLSRRDWREWLAGGRLRLLSGPDFLGAGETWRDVGSGAPPAVVVHPVLARARARDVACAQGVFERIAFDAKANASARGAFERAYFRNTIANLRALTREANAAALEGLGRGCAAIVVGAGPSLDHAYRALGADRSRAIVIAADTALRPLVHHDIRPDIVVGVDPGAANTRLLTGEPAPPSTFLVGEASLAPEVLEHFGGRTFLFRVGRHAPWPWLLGLGIDRSVLPVWGSVVTAAFTTARLLGCDPIVFVGADLAFSGGQPYCRHTAYEDDWAAACASGRPLEDVWREALERREAIPAEDLRGARTRTSRVLLAFRDWLLEQMRHDAGRRYVNASGMGMLYGRGIVQASIREALAGVRREAVEIRGGLAAAHARSVSAATVPGLADFAHAAELLTRYRGLRSEARDAALRGSTSHSSEAHGE